MVYSKKTIILSRVQHFPGCSNFFFPIETNISCAVVIFRGGGGFRTPCPLWICACRASPQANMYFLFQIIFLPDNLVHRSLLSGFGNGGKLNDKVNIFMILECISSHCCTVCINTSGSRLGPSINRLVTDGNTKFCCRGFVLPLFQSTTAYNTDSEHI